MPENIKGEIEMKLLFFILPAHGHVQPTLPVVNELIQRGEQIIYYTTREFKQKIEQIGAEVRIIDDLFGMASIDIRSDSNDSSSPTTPDSPIIFKKISSETCPTMYKMVLCFWNR